VTGRRLRSELRIRFVKVAEYQARGVIHFHAVIRLDAHAKDGFLPPPARYDAALLCDAIALAARAVRLDVPGPSRPVRLGFGRELDTRPIWREPFAATGRAGSRCGSELHRQVRHQGRRRPRPARHPHPARRRDRRAPLHRPPQAHGGGGVGPRHKGLDR